MGSSVLYMSMSVDGFITGPNVRPDNGLGDQGQHLHDWVFGDGEGGDFDAAIAQLKGVNRQIWDETMATGAVLAGRHTFEPAGGWNGDHHDGVEIFIVSRHEAPDWVRKWKNVHYVADLGVAMREAKAAAGTRNVMMHGGRTLVPMAIQAGLLDELMLHQVPFLLGEGTRLFDTLGFGLRNLERLRVLEGEGVTHLHYRVRK
ncbi:dihydrofolate reductase family protein [Devosia sp.]|jgi:dihydrofolate reductase|uniref:dihydrofolate reductase family protein n=1 Tax=Devosia sp. TaxID=1871048 RepID=UPI003F7031FE